MPCYVFLTPDWYSAGSGVNRVQVVLSGLICRLLCFIQAKTLSKYGWMYVLAALMLVCVDVNVMSSDMTCTGCGMSAV